MKMVCKLEGELIVHVHVVPVPGEPHHGPGLVRATPVHHLQPDARFNLDERHAVGCGITAGGWCPDRPVVQTGVTPATRGAREQERHGDGRVIKPWKTPCLLHGMTSS